jgi:hypothetical protein
MKITIDLPGPVSISFEGEGADFDRFTDFLKEPPNFVSSLGSAPAPTLLPGGNGADPEGPETANPLDPAAVQARFSQVGASTDIERVTVIAQAAIEAGREGADFQLADQIYNALAIAKPARWKVTFGNARTRGYLQNVGRGVYKPTVPGENFARGVGGTPPKRRAQRPALALGSDAGGGSD